MTAQNTMLSPREKEAFSSDTAVMTIDEVIEDTKLGEATIYQTMKKGLFPKNFKFWGKKVVWLRSEIEAWKRWRIELGKGEERWSPPEDGE